VGLNENSIPANLHPLSSIEGMEGSAFSPSSYFSIPSVTNRSTSLTRHFGPSRCHPVSLICLVPDEIDETDQRDQTDERRDTNDKLGQSERLPHILYRDLAPCAERKILQFEGTVLNAPEPGHFMPQGLEQPSDFTVLALNQHHFQM
jgi:hypothetical protein